MKNIVEVLNDFITENLKREELTKEEIRKFLKDYMIKNDFVKKNGAIMGSIIIGRDDIANKIIGDKEIDALLLGTLSNFTDKDPEGEKAIDNLLDDFDKNGVFDNIINKNVGFANDPEFYMTQLKIAIMYIKSEKGLNQKQASDYIMNLLREANIEKRMNDILNNPKIGMKLVEETAANYSMIDSQLIDCFTTFFIQVTLNVGKIKDVYGMANAILNDRPGLILEVYNIK